MAANVIIAPQLFDGLCRLPAPEQARVNHLIHVFRANPAHPALGLERVQHARSSDVWAARAATDLRIILYKDVDTWALLYVDHHEQAYDWAARREIGRHSVTGALQIVESVDTVGDTDGLDGAGDPGSPIFQDYSDSYLISLGVPETWVPAVRRVCDREQLLTVCEKLPGAADRLVALADGEYVTPPEPIAPDRPVTEAADTRRQFFVVDDTLDLAAALTAPMERWISFLHPSQRALVEGEFDGPVKVSGSAGTGKTVVAMHRARYLARRGERVLLTTPVVTLCENIKRNLLLLCTGAERQSITVSTVYQQALDVVRQLDPEVRLATPLEIDGLLATLRAKHAPGYGAGFVRAEWDKVVRQQGVSTWDQYRKARREGRPKFLTTPQRRVLWKVFSGVLETLGKSKKLDVVGIAQRAEELLAKGLSRGKVESPYTAVIVDEVQDLSPPELRFVRALCDSHPGNLMLCGDAGQRVFPGGYTLRTLGIDVRGRSEVLRINYRTTEQIRMTADQLLGPATDDLDGDRELRDGTRSLMRGPAPVLRGYVSAGDELAAAARQVRSWLDSQHQPASIAVLTRAPPSVELIGKVFSEAEILFGPLGRHDANRIHLGTMHQARGLEFKRVLLIDCAAGVIPDVVALAVSDDPQAREAALASERSLLYMAMTRARDELVMTWSGRPSPFIEPLVKKSAKRGWL